jgi:hypothetical protein
MSTETTKGTEPKAFKGQFGLIAPEAETHTCEGQCGQELPRKKFPTTTGPDRRTGECRNCRNERQGREEKALARAAEAAKAEAEATAKRESAKAKRAATRAAKAKAS